LVARTTLVLKAFVPSHPTLKGGKQTMTNVIKRFVRDDSGLETVEYAVMTALIVGALVIAIGLLTAAISGRFDTVRGVISGIA